MLSFSLETQRGSLNSLEEVLDGAQRPWLALSTDQARCSRRLESISYIHPLFRHNESHQNEKPKEPAEGEKSTGEKEADGGEKNIDWSGGTHIQLYNGVEMPLLGLGTAALKEPHPIISYAVQHGYSLIDTASETGPWYHTEKIIGQVFSDYELQRADYFITTKLHPQDFGYDTALASFKTVCPAEPLETQPLTLSLS